MAFISFVFGVFIIPFMFGCVVVPQSNIERPPLRKIGVECQHLETNNFTPQFNPIQFGEFIFTETNTSVYLWFDVKSTDLPWIKLESFDVKHNFLYSGTIFNAEYVLFEDYTCFEFNGTFKALTINNITQSHGGYYYFIDVKDARNVLKMYKLFIDVIPYVVNNSGSISVESNSVVVFQCSVAPTWFYYEHPKSCGTFLSNSSTTTVYSKMVILENPKFGIYISVDTNFDILCYLNLTKKK
jgi:hypothetical protein